MTKRIQLSFLLTCLLLFTSCGNNPQGPKVHTGSGGQGGDGNGGNQKPNGVPTPYDIKQFKPGQYIAWVRRDASKKIKDCVKWTFTKVDPNEEIQTITGNYTKAIPIDSEKVCGTIQKQKVRTIKVNLDTGLVKDDELKLDDDLYEKRDPILSIYPYIYGETKPVFFEPQTYTTAGKSYSIFQVGGKNGRRFYNQPGHPFHAVVLSYEDKEYDGKWTYEFLESDPVIPYSPASLESL